MCLACQPNIALGALDFLTVDPVLKEFGFRVRQARESLKLTQSQLGLQAGFSRASVANIEGGRQGVGLDGLVRLAKALDVQPGELVPTDPRESPVIPADKLRGLSEPDRAVVKSVVRYAAAVAEGRIRGTA